MRRVTTIYECWLQKEITLAEMVRQLRSFYHSNKAQERDEVVRVLGSVAEPDATRELIQLFEECQWRATRLQIIAALSKYPTTRSFEFLMALALNEKDEPMFEAVANSLAATNHPFAARYLDNLSKYCGEHLALMVCVTLKNMRERNQSIYSIQFPSLEELPNLSRADIFALLDSVAWTCSEQNRSQIMSLQRKSLRDLRGPLFEKWMHTLALCMPNADVEFKSFIDSENYTKLGAEQKIVVINQLLHFTMTVQMIPNRNTETVAMLENAIVAETDETVRARLVRGVAQLGQSTPNLISFVRKHLNSPRLTASCLFFLEKCPSEQSEELINICLQDGQIKNGFAQSLVRALTAQRKVISNDSLLTSFIRRCLTVESGIETQLLTLNFMRAHPVPDLVSNLISFLKSDERLQIAAIVALKSYNNDIAVEALSECLRSPSESIVGRTLDTLTALPGTQAKRIALDYLEANLNNLEVCDKIYRCLKPCPGSNSEIISRLLWIETKNPDHPFCSRFTQLRERFQKI